jgi:hypothetical protein
MCILWFNLFIIEHKDCEKFSGGKEAAVAGKKSFSNVESVKAEKRQIVIIVNRLTFPFVHSSKNGKYLRFHSFHHILLTINILCNILLAGNINFSESSSRETLYSKNVSIVLPPVSFGYPHG